MSRINWKFQAIILFLKSNLEDFKFTVIVVKICGLTEYNYLEILKTLPVPLPCVSNNIICKT